MLGFENKDNTCWFNTSVHVLLHIPQIANLLVKYNKHIDDMLFKKRKNSSDVVSLLSELATTYWSSSSQTGITSLNNILDLFQRIHRQFAGKKPQDATESYMALVSTLENTFKKKNSKPFPQDNTNMAEWDAWVNSSWVSYITDVFVSQIRQNETFEHSTNIIVYPTKTIDQGINKFLDDGRTFTKFPLILNVLLQKSTAKEFIYYDFDITIQGVGYKLLAVMLHVDNHWSSICRTTTRDGESVWHIYNDTTIERIHDTNLIINKNAMFLVYERTSNITS